MKIGLDIDGVLADFESRLFNVLMEEYSVSENDLKMIQWDFRHGMGITDVEERKLMSQIFNGDNDNFPAIQNVASNCHRLIEKGYELVIMTARKDREDTFDWLEKHDLDFINPYFIDIDKNIPEVTYLLDDSPKKIARLADKVTGQAFLLETSQNKDCMDIFGRYTRVKNWEEFLKTMGVN